MAGEEASDDSSSTSNCRPNNKHETATNDIATVDTETTLCI